MAGEDQTIRIDADAGGVVSEFAKFESILEKQTAQLEKIIGVMNRYNTEGELTERVVQAQTKSGQLLELTYSKIGANLVKTADNLTKAGSAFNTFGVGVDQAAAAQRRFATAQATVASALGEKFSRIPQGATGTSIEQLEREQNKLAKLIAGRNIKGGTEPFIQGAVSKAETGVFSDRSGNLGNVERQAFKVVEAFKRVQDSAQKAQDDIARRAQAATQALTKQAQAAQAVAVANAKAVLTSQQAAKDANDIGSIVSSGLGLSTGDKTAAKASAINTQIARVKALVATQKVSGLEVLRIFEDIQSKKELSLNTAGERAAAAAITNLVNQQERYNAALARTAQQLGQVLAQAGRAATRDQDRFNASLKRSVDGLESVLKKVGEVASKTSDTEAFQQNALSRLGGTPQNATPQQLSRIQSAQNQIAAVLATGKIGVDEFSDVLTKFEKNSATILPGIQGRAVNALRSLSNAIKDVDPSPLKLLGLTWEGLIRLFAVQVIHQAIGRVLSGLEQATTRAADFSIKIAEIRTLQEGNAISSQTWARALRDVSDSFGIDLLDTTAAAYDILSNQVAKGTAAIGFLNEAAAFSKVTVSSLQDSVNLLSSAVNAYRTQGLSAARASEVLFGVIDLGRVRADEIADTFGNVAVLASQLNIPFEELGGAFATLTIQGIRADTSMTLLNNIFLKLLKPTSEMKVLLSEWGVSTGEAAIKTFGFSGVIQKLFQELDSGGVERIGDLVNEMRAIRGVLSLGNESALSNFTSNTEKFLNDAAANLDRAKKIALNDPGNRFKQQTTQFSNFITQDIGRPLFETFVRITESLGGIRNVLEGLTSGFQGPTTVLLGMFKTITDVLGTVARFTRLGAVIQGLTPILGGITSAWIGVKLATLAASIANSGWVQSSKAAITLLISQRGALISGKTSWSDLAGAVLGSINPYKLAFVAITAIIGSLAAAEARAEALRLELVRLGSERISGVNQSLFEGQQKGFEKLVTQTTSAVDARNRIVLQKNAQLNALLSSSLTEVSSNVAKQQELIANAGFKGTVSFEMLINGDTTRDPKDAIKLIAESITKSIDEVVKLKRELATTQFDESLIGSDTVAATEKIFGRISTIQNQIRELFFERNMDGVRHAFEEINDLIKEQLAGREGLDSLIQKTKEQLAELKVGDSKKGIKEAIGTAESKGLKLLDLGNVRAATEEFQKADKLAESLANKQDSLNKKLRDLGVATPNTSGADSKRLEDRLKAIDRLKVSDKNPEKLLLDNTKQRIALEEFFQKIHTKRLVDQTLSVKAIETENKSLDDQSKRIQTAGRLLQENLQTHNETLTVINEQVRALREISQTIVNEGTTDIPLLGPSTFDSNVADIQFQLEVLDKLQKRLTDSRENADKVGTAFAQDRSKTNFDNLNSAIEQRDLDLKNLTDRTQRLQQSLKEFEQAQTRSVPFFGLAPGNAEEGNLEKVFRNGQNAAQASEKLQKAIEKQQEEVKRIKEQEKALFDESQKQSFNTQAIEAFGFSSTTVISRLSEELTQVTAQAKDLQNVLSSTSPTITPSQLGGARFSARVSSPFAAQPTGGAQGVTNTFQGDIIVQVQEVVDNEINPAELGRALARGIRSGAIRRSDV